MLKVGIVGTFAASLEDAIRRNLTIPCEIVVSDEAGIFARLAELDVLVTMVLTGEMVRGATRLKLAQAPGAGLDRIDRAAIPSGVWLAKPMGHRRCSTSRLARTRRQDHRDSRLWQDRSGGRPACPRFRHECMRGAPKCSAFH